MDAKASGPYADAGTSRKKNNRRASAVLVVLKSEAGLSHLELVKHFAEHSGDRNSTILTGRTASRGTACAYRISIPPYYTN